MQERKVDNKEGLTLLSRIPYLGHLFRIDTGETQKSELIILLKATVINDDADWQQDLDRSEKRIKKLDSEPRWKRAF
ncbi:MAG: hypothetical protein GQ569_12820 [Methylococcaceae bacterium]|nr:hypothetical protein [Methylococcaceae bacterium]